MFKIIGQTDINFIGHRRKAFFLSAFLILLGLTAFVMIMLGKGNMGLEFEGGTLVQGNFEQPINIGNLRNAINDGGFPEASIVELFQHGAENSYKITVKETTAGDERAADKILSLITAAFPDNQFTRDSEHTIGPAVGDALRRSAQWAVLISICGLIIYIWIRFDFRSGIAATVATFHDVLAVLGIFWLLNIEMTLLIVTALLTLAGYSLTDTVVVYDRIRENLKKFRKKGEFVGTVNSSINEVLSRTLMTSISTLLVVVTLYIFGGEVLRDFSLAMIIGVMVGTYSSVFVASPIVVEWEAKFPKRFK
jgi:preprotein translocase subunit SecF